MPPPKNLLGKGLGAIFPDLAADLAADLTGTHPAYIQCGIEELVPNRYQSRKIFAAEDLDSLVASIRESGIIQPIVVRRTQRGFEIIAGERRWRAAQKAGLKQVPVVVREAGDMETAAISLIENVQRSDLNPMEEAEAYEALAREFDLTQEDISARVGKDRSTVANALRLLRLPEEVKKALRDRRLSAGHARALLALGTRDEQLRAAREVLKKSLSVRETEELIRKARKKAPVRRPKPKDLHMTELEKKLSARMMTRVSVKGSGKGGTIQVRYTSNNDLDRIVRIILEGD
ncbi:MAG TPA: ParB/RepB/Spo0J family partition protein [Syntrophales bacterium]|nr:ParB/RepB/Spo0J family partition protein [Syntrophales bacterium]